MPLPTARDIAAAIEKDPEAFDAYLNANYPLPRKDAPPPPRDLPLSGLGSVSSDAYTPEIVPTEAERIAEAATRPTGSPDWQEPASLMDGLDTSGLASRTRTRTAQGATATPNVAINPPPTTAPSAVASSFAPPASSIASSLAVTPNYYLGSHPVNYGVATGGAAPAGTVTPSGNVTTGAAPAAGAQGGGGTPPAGSSPATGMLAQTALSSLSGAATSYAASQAVPDPTLPTVNPVLADFPIIQIQPKAPIMG